MDNAHPTLSNTKGIAVLSEFIERNPDSRELKRALVKLALAGKLTLRLLSFLDPQIKYQHLEATIYYQGLTVWLGYQGSKAIWVWSKQLK